MHTYIYTDRRVQLVYRNKATSKPQSVAIMSHTKTEGSPVSSNSEGTVSPGYSHDVAGFKNSSLEYIAQQGENGGDPTYQEVSGAPIERKSPLGLSVTWITIGLNLTQMIGTGVFATRESSTIPLSSCHANGPQRPAF
jgi:hypothetical protein